MPFAYCLVHGLMTLHLRTECGEEELPAASYEDRIGAAALFHGGARARRVARWDAAGWDTWWALVERRAEGRPLVAAVPPLEGGGIPAGLPSVHLVPPIVAVRAAGSLPRGMAIYVGAFGIEAARFDAAGIEEPSTLAPGLEALYRAVVAERFRRQRRALLPAEVPALLREGEPVDVTTLLVGILPLLAGRPAILGGEDGAVTAALAAALGERGHEVGVVDPLDGLERLLWAVGGVL